MDYNVFDINISKGEKPGFTVSRLSDSRMIVNHVDPLGTACKAGLKKDDYILKINGTEIKNKTDLISYKSDSSEKINMIVKRFNNLGSNHSSSVNELNNLLKKRYGTDGQSSEREGVSTKLGTKLGINMVKLPAPRKISLDMKSTLIPEYPPFSQNNLNTINDSDDTSDIEPASSVPTPRKMSIQLIQSDNHSSSYVKESSNRKSAFTSVPSLCEINPHTSIIADTGNGDFEKVTSTRMVNSESCNSLFDSNSTNSPMVEYIIDWSAIYRKISATISCPIEVELVNYFRNLSLDLTIFPRNCLHRFITFDDVLGHLFCNILSMDSSPDFEAELRKIDSKMCHSDYALIDFDILKILRCYMFKSNEINNSYSERKRNLEFKVGQLKESLYRHLKKNDKQSIDKIDKDISKINDKLPLLITVLVQLATSMSMWKFSVDVPSLFPGDVSQPSPLTSWQINVSDFKSSEKIIHQQIINLFKLFKDNCQTEVLDVIDRIFSENIEVSICLSILKEKK